MNYLFATLKSGIDLEMLPIGLAYVAASLIKTGRRCFGLMTSKFENPLEALINFIIENKIDVLCLSELSANFPILRETIDYVKANTPHVVILVGGGIITADPIFITQNLNFDFGCIGYGEETIRELAECLETKGDFSQINGLVYKRMRGDGSKDNNIIITQSRKEPKDLDDIPFPALDLFGFGKNNDHVLRIVGSRSCAYNCTFCFHPSGYRYKQRSLANIFNEIDYWMAKYPITHIDMNDELFGLKIERVKEFCDNIKKRKLTFDLQLRVDIVSEELVKILAEAGVTSISYGIESMNQCVLDSMQKKITIEQVEKALALTRKFNIPIIGNLIFGDCIETYEMAKESLNWWFKNIHYGISLSFIRAYPGTVLYNYGIESGRIKNKLNFYENKCPVVNLSAMSDIEFKKLEREISLYNKLNGEPITNFEIKEGNNKDIIFSINCPNCNIKNHYNNISNGSFPDGKHVCKNCGSKINLSDQCKDLLETQYYFDELKCEGKKIAIWGTTERALFRFGMNRKMLEHVILIVDLMYQNFEGKFLGFEVNPIEALIDSDINTLYIGAVKSRSNIIKKAKEILKSKVEIIPLT
jgi:radical SAM superfamily enzyme YgiQ (UPF0313 family)